LGHHVVGYLSILLGAVSWWFLITYVINKVRARFNVRSIWLINRGIGLRKRIDGRIGFTNILGRILAIQIQPEPHQNQTAQNLQNILISLYKIDVDRHA